MLNYELTPNHTGLALWGDYATLERLHEFVHEVVVESSLIEDKEGFILGLAYDIRRHLRGNVAKAMRITAAVDARYSAWKSCGR